jgi:phosphoribosylglycinamide formyltransferase-1
MAPKLRIGALVSGGGTNLQAIIDACQSNRNDGDVVFVGSDNPRAGGLARAQRQGIASFVIDYGAIIRSHAAAAPAAVAPDDFDPDEIRHKQHLFGPETSRAKLDGFLLTRAVAEAQLLEKISTYAPDLIVLAGFMRNLTPYFIDRFNTDPAHPRIMNIHPALLPAFPGVDGYGDTFRYGCKIGGCTVHFIDYGEDSGPIIGQKCFPISEEDTLDSIKEKGLALEWQLYPACIQLFAEHRLHTIVMTYTDHGRVTQRRVVKIAQPAA